MVRVCVRFMCLRVLRGALCDVVGLLLLLSLFVGVLIICLLDVLMLNCVLVSGLCLCLCCLWVCHVYVCECNGGDLCLFVIHCVMLYDASVRCDGVGVSP